MAHVLRRNATAHVVEGDIVVWDILKEAGWPIYPLLLASVIAVALIIERLMVLRKSRIIPDKLLGEVLALYKNNQITPDIITRIEGNSPLGRVLAAGLRTPDIWSEGTTKVGTREMGDAVVAAITGKTITTKS